MAALAKRGAAPNLPENRAPVMASESPNPARGGSLLMPISDSSGVAPSGRVEGETSSFQENVYKKYPILQKHGIEVGFGKSKGPNDKRQIEFYSPEESESPRPGKPYVEIYNRDMPGLEDVAYTDALHYLHKVDPKMREYREWLRENMTPEQIAMSHKRYKDYTDPSSKHYNPDNPESRSYKDWFEMSDLDQLLGGYVAGVWPKDMYSPEQIRALDEMVAYSKAPKK